MKLSFLELHLLVITPGSGAVVNITNVGYSSITGIMTVTTSGPHNLNTSGQRSDVLLTGIGMTCDLDNGGSTHVYPRTTDPAYCGTPVLSTPIALTHLQLMLELLQLLLTIKVVESHNLFLSHQD